MTKKKKTLKVNEGYPEGKSDANSNSGALTAEEISEKYTVAELRDILRENGLKVSGRKQELVERVLPILNDESSETSGEDVSDEVELTEKEKVIEAEKILLTQTEDSGSADDTELSIPVNEEFLTSSLDNFGINYGNLAIKEKISTDDNAELTIQGFTKNGLSMSDYNMSVVAASDSSNINFKLNIPEVSYTDFETTIFTFKNLDLFILPSSNPQSLEISALLDTLEIITETNYVNLKDLNLFFKSFPDENGARLDINIKNFLYPDFNGTSFNFKNLDFNLAIGLNEQNLVISVNLPKLNLLNKNYAVNLSDLNLNIVVPDLELSNLDLSINMSDFHYTNFDDVLIDMDKVDVSIDPILNSSNFNVNIGMNTLDATGLNSFDELFPMLSITAVNFKNSADDSIPPINLTCLMSLFDISKMSLSSLVSLLGSGFDLETYTRNMPGQYKTSLDADDVDISSTEVPYSDNSGFNIGKIFKNCDYSSLNTIVLDLSGLIDSTGIDLSQLGIDVSDYDLSAISLSDLIDTLTKSEFIMSLIALVSKLSSVKLDNLDFSGLVVSFDKDKFDISSLLGSLNLSELDISGILDMFNKSDVDLASVFKNCDYSCLGSIVLDLSGLIDSLGIDLSDLGIDLSDYDLSAISLSDIIDVLSKFEFNMSTISAVFKLFGLELDDVDLSGLISSFDTDNFDISALLGSLNLSGLDISGISDMFNNSDVDLEKIFEKCDYSCLGAIVLDVSGLIDSLGIDLSDLGIDVSDYDLSAISLSDLIDLLIKSEFVMSLSTLMSKLFTIKLDNIDTSGLIVSFDSDNFDISGLLTSLDLSAFDISGILDMYNMNGFDLTEFLNNLISLFMVKTLPEVTNTNDTK